MQVYEERLGVTLREGDGAECQSHGILRHMGERNTLERLPMTPGYFRLILRGYGDTPERRAAILEGTGVTEDMAADADISLFQQVRQIENMVALDGDGWALNHPDLWNPASHGPLGVAGLTAPDIAGLIDVLERFGFVRAPFYRMTVRRGPAWRQLDYAVTVSIEERLWRPMMEIALIGVQRILATVLTVPTREAAFHFACPAPSHADKVRAVLGEQVVYNAPVNAVRFPSAWLAVASPFADAALHAAAVAELQAAVKRVSEPVGLRGRVERLLRTLPVGRLTAEETARLMGVSRRTLVRKLAETGVGYRELLDAELRERAKRMLRDSSLTQARIAELLGYADPTSFSRSCRRWFGTEKPR